MAVEPERMIWRDTVADPGANPHSSADPSLTAASVTCETGGTENSISTPEPPQVQTDPRRQSQPLRLRVSAPDDGPPATHPVWIGRSLFRRRNSCQANFHIRTLFYLVSPEYEFPYGIPTLDSDVKTTRQKRAVVGGRANRRSCELRPTPRCQEGVSVGLGEKSAFPVNPLRGVARSAS